MCRNKMFHFYYFYIVVPCPYQKFKIQYNCTIEQIKTLI